MKETDNDKSGCCVAYLAFNETHFLNVNKQLLMENMQRSMTKKWVQFLPRGFFTFPGLHHSYSTPHQHQSNPDTTPTATPHKNFTTPTSHLYLIHFNPTQHLNTQAPSPTAYHTITLATNTSMIVPQKAFTPQQPWNGIHHRHNLSSLKKEKKWVRLHCIRFR